MNENPYLQKIHELENAIHSLNNRYNLHELMISEIEDYAIFALNREGIVENWNKGAEKIKGYRAEEIIGQKFSIFYTSHDRQEGLPDKLLSQAAQNGKATHEGWRKRKDGSLFWGSVVLTAIHDQQMRVIGFSKVTRDLTEKKQQEDQLLLNARQLEEKNTELQKMNSELESFAYVSSHDLQEPLRKIQTFASLILEREVNTLSDTGKDYFRRMQSAAGRMQMLIEDLLSYSRAGTKLGNFINSSISEMVYEAQKELKDTLEQKKAVIETDIRCEARVIPFQFRQLLMNLISNSLKFQQKDKPPRIRILAERLNGNNINRKDIDPEKVFCHLSIRDNGIGFEEIYKDRIFEVFQRLHGKDEYEGTGVGLAIVKKIAENHQGWIEVSSESGKGSSFDIYFPQ